MEKKFLSLAAAIVLSLTGITNASAAAPFYEGKTIRIIVGYSAGGGFDLNARTIGRYLGKYIPGNPTVIVENMPGAGSLIAANNLYKAAKPDGLTMGHFIGSLIFNEIFGQPGVEFNARKFQYVGAAMQEKTVYALSKASGITSFEKWMNAKTPVKLGGMAPGDSIDNNIRVIKTALGLPMSIVAGYKGTVDIRLAIESGEVSGSVFGWDSMKSVWRKSLETGAITPVLQVVAKPLPDLPNVPLAIQYAKTEEGRQLIEVCMHNYAVYSRPFVLPPGVPEERVQILRKAFQETMQDRDFLRECEKANMGLDPVTGAELEGQVSAVFKLKPAFMAKVKEVLFK